MDTLQYVPLKRLSFLVFSQGFKPCYKWIPFNTMAKETEFKYSPVEVLNLVINGYPSIQNSDVRYVWVLFPIFSFKPCYKWIPFNTRRTDEVKQAANRF